MDLFVIHEYGWRSASVASAPGAAHHGWAAPGQNSNLKALKTQFCNKELPECKGQPRDRLGPFPLPGTLF